MALSSCWDYWTSIKDNLPADVVLVNYTPAGGGTQGQITLNFEDYGVITYTSDSAGTNNNPHIVSSPEDLIYFMTHTFGSSDHIHLAKNINFNESEDYKFGFSGIPSTNFNTFNGLNYSIQNLILSGNTTSGSPRYFGGSYIKNLVFENLIFQTITHSSSLCFFGSQSHVDNVRFGCYLFGSDADILFYGPGNRIYYTDCTFNIKGSTYSYLNIAYCDFNRCHLNFDLLLAEIYSSIAVIYFGQPNNILNSYITGILTFDQSPSYFLYQNGSSTINSSYFCLKLITSGSLELLNGTDRALSGSVYSFVVLLDENGDDISFDHELDFKSNFVEHLSYSNATNPDFLLSKGFPVAKIEV